jgi:hypothetical protein
VVLRSAEGGSRKASTSSRHAIIDKIEEDFLPAGFRHLLATFADPFLVESWAGMTIEVLPSLEEQLRLFHESVMSVFEDSSPAVRSTTGPIP